MTVNLSVKHVPNDLARRLRQRARRHHRSLQGELLAILHEAVEVPSSLAVARTGREAAPHFRLESPWDIAPRSEAALMVREDRDGRTFTIGDLFEHVSSLGEGTPDESTAWIRQDRSSRNAR